MYITFNELRKIKDLLPHGGIRTIADRLNLDEDTVRNYFGGSHYSSGMCACAGIHLEQGPNGGVVTLHDTTILDLAKTMLREKTLS